MNSINYSEFVISEKYYTNISEYISVLAHGTYKCVYQRQKRGGYYVYNVPCAFDIETSSFYVSSIKQVCMYVWQFNFNGIICIGRTWNDFLALLRELQNLFRLSEENRIYCYVHNLSYEFQFFRKWIQWINVFSTEIRNPIKALCEYGIEFRDSYILSGYSLEMTAKQLHTYHVEKKTGYLNYDIVRTSETELTHDEIIYCIYDVIVVCAYIQECINESGNITKIPLTNTGRVRNFCRKNCFNGFSHDENIRQQTYYDYRALMNSLTLETEEYIILKQAFQGGFTHANCQYVGETLENVSSYDFTSSYPYVMLSEKFPMGKGFRVNITSLEMFNKYARLYCIVGIFRLTGVSPKIYADNPISRSKCVEIDNCVENNGRVVYADSLTIVCTEIDLQVYLTFYNVEHIEISTCYCYARGYLPRNFILSILKLYNDKTKLKGVKGKEREYLHSKEMLNSCYGMTVTDIVRDDIDYIDEWETSKGNADEQIEKYNNSKNRFLFYPWGIYVTSYARKNLFSGIQECNSDYVYSDTDSVKILNKEAHESYFNDYNMTVKKKLNTMCDFYKIPISLCCPKTQNGKEKLIGVWDYEGTYKRFKTLGAKRYLYLSDELHSTVAGVSKRGLVQYMLDMYGTNYDEIFEHFNNGLCVPENYTGKLTHTYIDNEMRGDVIDYKGKQALYYEKSGVHLSKTDYEMSLSRMFIDFLKGVKVHGTY